MAGLPPEAASHLSLAPRHTGEMRALVPWLVVLCAGGAAASDGMLLFHATLERTPAADAAAGDRVPLTALGVRIESGAAMFPPNAKLTYDARGNLYAEQGTAAFWWRPDEPPGRMGFPIFQVSYEQHSTWDYNFARVEWTGSQLAARIRDRNLRYHRAIAAGWTPRQGEWAHIAIAWSENGGLKLYVNGKSAGQAAGPMALDARLDQFGYMGRATTPHHTSGCENPGSIRDARIYAAPLDAQQVALLAAGKDPGAVQRAACDRNARFGWTAAANVPAGAAFTVKRISVRDGRDVAKFCLKGVDGKRETLWPTEGHGFVDEGKIYRVRPEAEPVNLLRTTGDLAARFSFGGASFERSAAELHYRRLAKAAPIELLTIERKSGAMGDLELLRVEGRAGNSAAAWLPLAPGDDGRFRMRRHPETFNRPGAAYRHFLHPVKRETPLDAVRLRFATERGAYYYVAVQDPASRVYELIEFDARATGEQLDVTLDFPDVVVSAGGQIAVTIASSSDAAINPEAQWIEAPLPAARERHMTERVLRIRDSFQMLSEARPWMMIGRQFTLPALRRQLKLVDELYTLMEDARRVNPASAIVNGYWSWVNRAEAPPPYREPAAADASAPVWATRQLAILKQFRRVVDWWIENRQVESGEMGGGLADDTDMIQNWPAVALLDGPVEPIAKSVRKVLEACYAQGMVERGMNSHRTDALHAYEEGMNAYAPAFLLDYGNPVLFHRMMETAAHYERLTGINAAGHRHFRSYHYSTTDVVEEGYHAREDSYSHLILQPGLFVAWYNGAEGVRKVLREFGDGLLAHWTKERYPRLAREIFFADDRAESRSSPGTETVNLLWGLYDLERDPRYLWPLREAVKSGDIQGAAAVNGPWTNLFEAEQLRDAVAAAVARRGLFDRNLQTDQGGLVARTLAWQIAGDVKPLEEAQLALRQHMDQNIYMYTLAEQYTDRIWIPTLAAQRERMGGVALVRNHIYPGHAVSWENTGGEVAALVEAARQDYLRVALYNAGVRARKIKARVWQLENGRYSVALAGAGREAKLKRHSAVELEIPARKLVKLEIRQLEKGVPLWRLPDLAIAAEEMRQERVAVTVPVHNIGGVASGAFTASLRDKSGRVLGTFRHAGLPAPADLRPSTAVARFEGVRPQPGLRISVRQDGGGEEICDTNNEI